MDKQDLFAVGFQSCETGPLVLDNWGSTIKLTSSVQKYVNILKLKTTILSQEQQSTSMTTSRTRQWQNIRCARGPAQFNR